MHQQQDPAHLEAMQAMRALLQNPSDLEKWFESKRKEFDALPES